MLQQAISLSLLAAAVASIPPAASQGIQGSIGGSTHTGPPATRVLVATPYPSAPGDSVAAVAIGDAMRRKLSGNIGGSDWLVITRQEMNKNLMTWGYSADQLFSPESSRTMAVAMTARVFVMTTLTKGADGRMTASVRVTGIADEAGQVVKATQLPGQKPEDFAGKITDQINVIFKAYPDAKQCADNLTVNKAKAAENANKAIKSVPNYGFPEYCLGLIEQSKDSVGPETMRHFKNAIIGDPLSLKAINQVAIIDQKKHDSTAVVADFQQMLTVAPTNRALADQAVLIFRQYNRPDAAEQVVDAQTKLDPSSPDWPELKGNLCAGRGVSEPDTAKARLQFACAYAAFNQEYTLDPARADTTFYPRMVFVAGNRADSMLWAQRWSKAFPSSTDPLELKAQLYTGAGQIDSAVAVVTLISKIDPTASKPVLVVAKALIDAKQPEAALQFMPYFTKADENARNTFAGLLINVLQPLAQQTPRPDSSLVLFGQAVIDLTPTAPNYLIYANYFMAVGLADQLTPISTSLRTAKSCDVAKSELALLVRLEPALNVAATSPTEGIANFAKTFLTNLPPEKTYVDGMMKELKCP